ncbi:MAG: isocitrate/isopropylmalate family dehydrogenase, partial [Dehalococcoidia bacterium]|nr:isocitrate/isopropylmalate family dehydrogenase [Dehalococcoidia bacterium]
MAEEKRYEVAVIRGGANDGSGPEMMDAALCVLKAMLEEAKVTSLKFVDLDLAAEPEKSWETVRSLGVVFKAPTNSPHLPEGQTGRIMGSVQIRRGLDLYANITPCKSYKGITKALRPDIDMVMVRENVEGLFGSPSFSPAPGIDCNVRIITRAGSERIARVAFQLARGRRKKVTVSTVPPGAISSDGTFTAACETVAREFPDVKMEIFKPDSVCGMLMDRADYFDVVVAPNDWGFILQDGMVATTGSVGLGPRANLGDNTAL